MENLQTTKSPVEDYQEIRASGFAGTALRMYERSSFGGVFFKNSKGDLIVMSPMELDALTGNREIITDIIPREGARRVHKALVPCWAWDSREHLALVLGVK